MRARLPGRRRRPRLQHLPLRRPAAVDVLLRAADERPSHVFLDYGRAAQESELSAHHPAGDRCAVERGELRIVFALFLLVLLADRPLSRAGSCSACIPLLALQQAFALGLGFLLGVAQRLLPRRRPRWSGSRCSSGSGSRRSSTAPPSCPTRDARLLCLNPMTAAGRRLPAILLHGAWPDWSHFACTPSAPCSVLGLASRSCWRFRTSSTTSCERRAGR